MFTGIVDHGGTIIRMEPQANTVQLWIDSQFTDLREGESIAVDGACLTVTTPQKGQFSCDVSSETFALTIAKYYSAGRVVNLERALKLNDRLGGHFMMGHVDQVANVEKIEKEGNFTKITFSGLDDAGKPFTLKKGSVAINGVSLTINDVYNDCFHIMLIPHTLEKTNLRFLQVGDKVNIEYDWLAKVAVQQLLK